MNMLTWRNSPSELSSMSVEVIGEANKNKSPDTGTVHETQLQ